MDAAYAQHDTFKFFQGLMALQCHATAVQVFRRRGPAAPLGQVFFGNSPLNPLRALDENPVTVKLEGVQQLVAMNPFLAGFANKFPENVELSYGAGQGRLPPKGDAKTLRISLNMSEPSRNWKAAGDAFNRAGKHRDKPDFGIAEATIDGQKHPVTIKTAIKQRFW